jgi:hypothetical protein
LRWTLQPGSTLSVVRPTQCTHLWQQQQQQHKQGYQDSEGGCHLAAP